VRWKDIERANFYDLSNKYFFPTNIMAFFFTWYKKFLFLSLDKGDTHEGVLTFAYTDLYDEQYYGTTE